jgi:hypothetical protein
MAAPERMAGTPRARAPQFRAPARPSRPAPAAGYAAAATVPLAWVITPAMVVQADAESAMLFDVVREGTYPVGWPVVAWLVKRIAGGRCEHCGRRRRLAVHHLDRDKQNLQSWNLVALCWDTCHLWVETHISIDRDQLDLFEEDQPAWLAERLRDRKRWPLRDRAALAPIDGRSTRDAGVVAGTERACACGCGRLVRDAPDGRRRMYFSGACRQRMYVARRLQQLSLFAAPRS